MLNPEFLNSRPTAALRRLWAAVPEDRRRELKEDVLNVMAGLATSFGAMHALTQLTLQEELASRPGPARLAELLQHVTEAAFGDGATEADRAADFLMTALAQGEQPMATLANLADQVGISMTALRRAKKRLNVTSHAHGEGEERYWTWRKPDGGWTDEQGEGEYSSRVVVIFGPPGCGKTRLALALADVLISRGLKSHVQDEKSGEPEAPAGVVGIRVLYARKGEAPPHASLVVRAAAVFEVDGREVVFCRKANRVQMQGRIPFDPANPGTAAVTLANIVEGLNAEEA